MNYFSPKNFWKRTFAVGFLLFISKVLLCQLTNGHFKSTSIEKINGSYFVFGINDKNEIHAAKYSSELDSVKEIVRPVNEQVGSFFGMPFIAAFYQRNAFDLRIIYKSGIVAWLTLDMDLKETGYKEYDYSKNSNETSVPKVFNPIYSIPSYGSNFVSPIPSNGYFVGKYYYQFLSPSSPEFSNTITDKYSYYRDAPVIRKMELMNNSGPFYKEINRVPLLQNNSQLSSSFDNYNIRLMTHANGFLYFLATNPDDVFDKDAVKVIVLDENSLAIMKEISLRLDTVYPQMGSSVNAKTVYDSINHRIVQFGNFTGIQPDSKQGYRQCESFFICAYDLNGKLLNFRQIPYPNYELYTSLRPNKFDKDYKRIVVEEKGISFFKDGSIRLVGKNDILTSFKYSSEQKGVYDKGYYYSTILVSFINLNPTFETIESKIILKKRTHKNHNYEFYDALKDFRPGTSVNDATALFVVKESPSSSFGLTQGGEDTRYYSVYSSYYGMKNFKIGFFKNSFIYNGESCFVFDKSKGGKFHISYVSHHN